MRIKNKIRLKRAILPFFIGGLPLLISIWGTQQLEHNRIETLQNTLSTKAEQVTNRMQQRATDIFILVQDVVNFISLQESLTPEVLERRIENLNLGVVMPEIKLVGFIEESKSKEFHYPLSLNAPENHNQIISLIKETDHSLVDIHNLVFDRTIEDGFNMFPVPGNPEMIVLYAAVYNHNDGFAAPINLREEFKGMLYIYINLDEYFETVRAPESEINFTATRSANYRGLMSAHFPKFNTSRAPHFRHKTLAKISNETWVINFYSEPDFETQNEIEAWGIILGFGGTIGLLLFLVVYLLSSGRARAMQIADSMTKSLRQNEAMLELVINSIPQFIFWKDKNSVYLGCNNKFAKAAGVKYPENIIGKNDYDLAWEKEDAENYLRDDKLVLDANKPKYHIIEESKSPSGERILIDTTKAPMHDENGNIIGVLGTFEDITVERQRQEIIEQEQRRLRLAADSFKIAVWDWDPSRDIANWDSIFNEFLGIQDKKLTEKKSYKLLLSLVHPDDRNNMEETITEAVKNEKDFEITFRVIRPDESIRFINVRGTARRPSNDVTVLNDKKGTSIKHENGDTVNYFGISFDVTEEKALEQLKSSFVSIASHQLRTPLTAIRWFLQMVMDNAEKEALSDKQLQLLNKVDDASHRMQILVNDLLSVSRLETGSIQLSAAPISLADSTQKVVDDVAVSLKEKKQKVSIVSNVKDTTVLADATMLEQVIQNLVTNAIKYSPEKTEIKIQFSSAKTHIQFDITNKGIPISEKDQGKLFMQFFRSKEASESKADGSGLGLYIAKAIIEKSGGEISATYTKIKGTTFSFTLPKK